MTTKVSACFDGVMIKQWKNFTFTPLCGVCGGALGGACYVFKKKLHLMVNSVCFHNLVVFLKS